MPVPSKNGQEILKQARPHVMADLGRLVETLSAATSQLEPVTVELIRLAVAVALGNRTALKGHLQLAQKAGASRDQVLDAILLCLPGSGAPRCLEALEILEDNGSS